MKGIKCLYPFGFHCTGMPIQASATKLAKELEKFGCPPVFPEETEPEPLAAKPQEKTMNKKGKMASKKSKAKYQWQILAESGVEEDLIPSFAASVAQVFSSTKYHRSQFWPEN